MSYVKVYDKRQFKARQLLRSGEDERGSVKYLERSANTAIILAVAVFLWLVIRGEMRSSTLSQTRGQDLVGNIIHKRVAFIEQRCEH